MYRCSKQLCRTTVLLLWSSGACQWSHTAHHRSGTLCYINCSKQRGTEGLTFKFGNWLATKQVANHSDIIIHILVHQNGTWKIEAASSARVRQTTLLHQTLLNPYWCAAYTRMQKCWKILLLESTQLSYCLFWSLEIMKQQENLVIWLLLSCRKIFL